MMSEAESDQHYSPSVRLCDIARPATGSCGFHLTRSKWDPYPWVSGVESGSAAETAGLQAGDCVLEVNGEDVLGQRIGDVASKVRARDDRVTLLLWNAGSDPQCSPEVRSRNDIPEPHFYDVDCGLLGCDAVYSCGWLPTSRRMNLVVIRSSER
jgi:hypothetical protein